MALANFPTTLPPSLGTSACSAGEKCHSSNSSANFVVPHFRNWERTHMEISTQKPSRGNTTALATAGPATPTVILSGRTEGKLGGRGGGAGVLERPGLDQSTPDTAPRTEEGGEMGKARQSVRLGGGDRYRVLLLDHERHTETQVAKVIPRVVPSVTPDEARKCFHDSREFGFGLVTVAVKEHAEFYVQMLTRYGLRSKIEQDSSAGTT